MSIKFINKNGFIENRLMWKDIAKNLIENGFKLVSANGQLATELPSTAPLSAFVIEAGADVDPCHATQKWRLCVKLTADSTKVYTATPDQISDLGEVTVSKVIGSDTSSTQMKDYSGTIGGRRRTAGGNVEDRDEFFWHRGVAGGTGASTYYGTMVFTADQTTNNILGTSPAAVPFTYYLAISDHGIALQIQVEGQDNRGCRHAWFVIQRAIDKDGTVVVTGKAPLFAMWSVNGGGSADNLALDNKGIMRMTVREADINVPTEPVSAVVHSADAASVINPLQMVPFAENGDYDFRLPQGFNTHRFSYPYELDLIGYASADVISNGTEVPVQVYDEQTSAGQPAKRTYIALSANNPDNTGMRIFMLMKEADKS